MLCSIWTLAFKGAILLKGYSYCSRPPLLYVYGCMRSKTPGALLILHYFLLNSQPYRSCPFPTTHLMRFVYHSLFVFHFDILNLLVRAIPNLVPRNARWNWKQASTALPFGFLVSTLLTSLLSLSILSFIYPFPEYKWELFFIWVGEPPFPTFFLSWFSFPLTPLCIFFCWPKSYFLPQLTCHKNQNIIPNQCKLYHLQDEII